MLEHVHHQVPVTALTYIGEDVILAGEGPYLKAYSTRTRKCLANARIFSDQAIHGIVTCQTSSEEILTWGGSYLKCCSVTENTDDEPCSDVVFRAHRLARTSDWILDAAFCDYEPLYNGGEGSNELVAIVTAHNALIVEPLSAFIAWGGDVSAVELKPMVPGLKCILYCAHIRWLSASQCLIASGTAFGDVVVWSATISASADGILTARANTHYTFSAHEGSVFGVRISADIDSKHLRGCKRGLATCSDDRTVRLWDLSDLSAESPNLTDKQRDTGFGARSEADQHAPVCLAKSLGHVSRIWHVRFPQPTTDTDHKMMLMSFGEDATNITWSIEGSEGDLPCSLKQVHAETAHAGKHIWSVAMSQNGAIATGGADGAIALRCAERIFGQTEEVTLAGVMGKQDDDNIKAYAFIAQQKLVATTEKGSLAIIDLGRGESQIISGKAFGEPNLRYSLVAAVAGIGFFASANTVYMVVLGRQIVPVFESERKIAGLFAIKEPDQGRQQTIHLVVTNVGLKEATYARFELTSPGGDDKGPLSLSTHGLILPDDFITTSFVFIKHNGGYATVLGSRNGAIAIYDMPLATSAPAYIPCAVNGDVHGKEAVTSLVWRAIRGDKSSTEGYLHSTGRDGTYAVYRLWRYNDGWRWRAEQVHHLTMPFGPNIEGLAFRPDGHILVWGFRSKHFVVQDLTAQQEVMAVECGGANRTWTFQPHDHLNGGTLAWTKSSMVFHRNSGQLPYTLMNTGGHGREIKVTAASSGEPKIIATGAEDTNIKLWRCGGEKGFKCLQTLRKHNTGVQHLQWSRDEQRLFCSGGFEEFFIWRVTQDVPDIGVGVYCESAHPDSGSSDLRIMGFKAREVDATEDHSAFEITMAYSDSVLKMWKYTAPHQRWTLIARGDYLTACLTHVFSLKSGPDGMVTTATDGLLTQWLQDANTSELSWSQRYKLHQNAILGFATCSLPDGSQLVMTGSDDNAIAFTRIDNFQTPRSLMIPRAHAAAVSGVAIVRQHNRSLLLASTSIDQRVKLWRLHVEVDRPGVEGIEVECLANTPTSVADVSGLETCKLPDGGDGLLVSGVGMELLRVAPESITA